VHSFTACMPLLAASRAFRLGRRCWSSPQQCYPCLCSGLRLRHVRNCQFIIITVVVVALSPYHYISVSCSSTFFLRCSASTDVFSGQSASDLPIALQCLDALIGKRRRHVPTSRVFAFVKRLSTLALQMDCHGSLALLALINNILSVSV